MPLSCSPSGPRNRKSEFTNPDWHWEWEPEPGANLGLSSSMEERKHSHWNTDGTYKEKTQSETKVLRDQEKLERCKSSPGARAEIQLAPHILRRCVGGEKGGSSSVQEILEQGRMSYILSMARCYTVCRKPTVSVYPLLNRVNLSTRQWRKKSHKRVTDRLCVSSIRA